MEAKRESRFVMEAPLRPKKSRWVELCAIGQGVKVILTSRSRIVCFFHRSSVGRS